MISPGETLVAAGAVREVEGYSMVPVRPRGAIDLSCFALQASPAFTTRPSASLGEASEVHEAEMNTAEELASLRAIRMQAYREKYGGPCRRRKGRLACACAVFTTPLVLVVAVLRYVFLAAISVLLTLLSVLLNPHFWLGFFAASAVFGCAAWQFCVESSAPMASQRALTPKLRVACQTDHPWAQELRGALWSAAALLAQGRMLAAEGSSFALNLLVHFANARDALLWPLFGWCPYRDADDALVRCAQRTELERVRAASDCAALKRAFHEGQRLFHPDHMRLKHPSCSDKVLEACSVALNAAMEERRRSLSCPAR